MGHIVFKSSTGSKDDTSTDQLDHIQYKKDVFLSYVEKYIESYLGQEGWQGGDTIDDDNVWIGWQEGHGPSLKAIIEKIQQKKL